MEDIIEGNKLIAEFMGTKRGTRYLDEDVSVSGQFEMLCSASELQYHISWDWLMPVVERIMDLCDKQTTFICHRFFIGVSSVNIKIEDMQRNFHQFDAYIINRSSRISAVYQVCVEFIEWYNKEKENE